jgi:DNA polymerase elongation subunit (family B)
MKKPKILLWDIETSLSLVTTFGIWDQNIPLSNIIQDWYIHCASVKELGNPKIKVAYTYTSDDRKVVEFLHKELSQADVIIAHNGDAFDIKKLNTRVLELGMTPLPPIKSIDTLKIARKNFKFMSNKLEYLAVKLGVEQKGTTSHGLWVKALKGDKKAIKEMVEYNKQDVVVLEQVYEKLKGYDHSAFNFNLYSNGEDVCPSCNSKNLKRNGYAYTSTGKYQRLTCTDCGKWSKNGINLLKTNVRKI